MIEKVEETIETKEEEETSETEETSDSEQETEEEKPEVADEKKVTQKELDKVYARMKLAEERAKKAEAKLAEKPTSESSDVDAIVEINIATKDLSPEEIAELRFRASVNKTTLSEARKDENFILWQGAHKEKVEKDQTLPPSTKQSITPKRKSLTDMTVEEKEDALLKMGVGKGKTTWAQQRQRDSRK